MASPKPPHAFEEEEELSEVQVMDSHEPLVTASSSVPVVCSARVLDSIEPLVPTVSSDSCGPVAGASDVAGPSGIAVAVATSGGSGPAPENDDEIEEHDVPAMPIPTGSSGRRVRPYVNELRSMWNWTKVSNTLGTRPQCLAFAEERGLILRQKNCPQHHMPMRLTPDAGQVGKFRCRKGNCRAKSVSRATGTWFEDARLPLSFIFKVMYAFSIGCTYETAMTESAVEGTPLLSSSTISDWYSYCRETIVIYELENQRIDGKIGGPGKIVQIDESKFGKRKYNRGRQIEGHWVIGMIEDGCEDLRLEVCPDNIRSADILVPLIEKHVAEGSIIHTDFWRAYDRLPEYGYTHQRVNHSDPLNKFVAPDSTHTQRIESQWRGMKKVFRQGHNRQDFTAWLCEYSWRRRQRIYHLSPFEEIITAVKYVYNIE